MRIYQAVLLAFAIVVGAHVGRAQDLSDTSEVHFTKKQLQSYYLVYDDVAVKHLRTELDRLSKEVEQGTFADTALLHAMKRENLPYFKSKFIVLVTEDAIYGGRMLRILFQDKPDKIFDAWMHEAKNWELDSFEEYPATPEEIHWTNSRFRALIHDKKHAM